MEADQVDPDLFQRGYVVELIGASFQCCPQSAIRPRAARAAVAFFPTQATIARATLNNFTRSRRKKFSAIDNQHCTA